MAGHDAHAYRDDRGLVLLVASFLAGPLALAIDILIGYALVKPACASGNTAMLTVVAAGAMTIAIAGLWIGWSCVARAGLATLDGGRREDRSYAMALVAVGLNAIAGLVIATSAIPHFFLQACE
jgi:hypothetical protein